MKNTTKNPSEGVTVHFGDGTAYYWKRTGTDARDHKILLDFDGHKKPVRPRKIYVDSAIEIRTPNATFIIDPATDSVRVGEIDKYKK